MIQLAAFFIHASASLSLPPGLLDAVCYVETGHDPNAYVADDAGTPSLGACQVKYETAVWLGFKGTEEQLMEPGNNIYFAGKYLAYQLHRYRDVNRALIGYNQGSAKQLTTTKYSASVIKQWQTIKIGDKVSKYTFNENENNDLVKFEKPGDSVGGVYLGKQPFIGKYGPSFRHIFKTAEGTKAFITSQKPNLLLERLTGREGEDFAVKFLGKKMGKNGQEYKNFVLSPSIGAAIPKEELPSFSSDDEAPTPDQEDAAQNEELAILEKRAKTAALLAKHGKKVS